MKKPEKPRTESLLRKSRTVIEALPLVYIGFAWERPTVQTFNAIAMDVISLQSIMSNSQLCVVSQSPKFLKRLCSSLGISSLGERDAKPEIWKVYYETDQNVSIPEGAVTVYTKKVSNQVSDSIKLTKNDERYPSLHNPADHQFLPVGKSPSVQQIPPYTYAPSMGSPTTPMSFLW